MSNNMPCDTTTTPYDFTWVMTCPVSHVEPLLDALDGHTVTDGERCDIEVARMFITHKHYVPFELRYDIARIAERYLSCPLHKGAF